MMELRHIIVLLLCLNIASSSSAQDPKKVDSLLNILDTAWIDTIKTKVLNGLSGIMWGSGEYGEGLEYAQRALEISKSMPTEGLSLAVSYHNIGAIYYLRGNYPTALENWQKAFTVYQNLNYSHGIASMSGNLGITYLQIDELDKALEFLNTSMEAYRNEGDKSGEARQYNNMGNLYGRQNKRKESLESYKKALSIREELDDSAGMAGCYVNIGAAYDYKGDAIKALEHFYKAIALYEATNQKGDLPVCYINIGDSRMKLGDFDEAEDNMLYGKKLAEEIGHNAYTMLAYESLTELYDTTQNYQKALEYVKLYTAIKDSMFNEDKSKEIGRLEAKYDFEKEEEARAQALEEKRNELETEKNRRDNLQFSAILIVMVLLFAGVFFIRRISIPIRLAEGMIFFSFLLFFEFMLVLLDPYIEQYSSGAPAIKLAFNAALAAMIFPLHSLFETKIKGRLAET